MPQTRLRKLPERRPSSILHIRSDAKCQQPLSLQCSRPPSLTSLCHYQVPVPCPFPCKRQSPPHAASHPCLSAHPHCSQSDYNRAVTWTQQASTTWIIKSPILVWPHKGLLVYPPASLSSMGPPSPSSAHLPSRLPFNSFWASGSLCSWLLPLLRTLFPAPLNLDNPTLHQYHASSRCQPPSQQWQVTFENSVPHRVPSALWQHYAGSSWQRYEHG